MKRDKTIAIYRRLRQQPLWRLLAATNGPIIIGLLQTHLYDTDRSLSASLFYERINTDLEILRAQGDDFPQTAQAYIANWVAEGYLERRFPAGASEEEYELTTSSVEAIRFISGLTQPHSAATESRLTLVIDALTRLVEDTDADKHRRIAALMKEKVRIDKEIENINNGKMHILQNDTALERVREIILLADDLAGDFRRVRDKFEQLNRTLREKILDHEGNRGEVLDSLFAGIDLISDSEAGRTFSAFWRLLTDPVQGATLDQALDSIKQRDFFTQLDQKERNFLLRLTRILLEQGGIVHEVLQNFAHSLKHFVRSQEYLEHRRLNHLLKEAQRAALTLKDTVNATETLHYTLELTSSSLRSLSQWTLHDPAQQVQLVQMQIAESAPIDLNTIGELIAQSEINFRELKANIQNILQKKSQASIAEVLKQFPATQGLGSVIGLLALGSRHGFQSSHTEAVQWIGEDHQQRSARIPRIFFLKERAHEFNQ